MKNINLNNTSIKNKITKAFLLVIIIALLISTVVTIFMLFNMRNMIADSGDNVGHAAAFMSAESLTDVVLKETSEIVSAKAEIMNGNLNEAVENLQLIRSYIEQLYENPDAYKPAYIPNYNDIETGVLSAHWFLQTGRIPNEKFDESDLAQLDLLDETYLLGNAVPLIKDLMNRRTDISTIVIQTETGINIQYDDQAYTKAKNGIPVMHLRSWFTEVRDNKDIYISDTYPDSIGRGLCITISLPIYGNDGTFAASLAFDISIADLTDTVNGMVVGENGYAIMLGADKVIAAIGLNESNEYDLPPYWNDVSKNNSGITESVVDEEKIYAVWSTVPLTEWKLVCVLPVSDVIVPAKHLEAEIISMTRSTIDAADKRILLSIVLLIVLLVAILVVVVIWSRTVAVKISEPILKLSSGAKQIGDGDLDHTISVKTGDEIEELAETFNKMVRNIKQITGEKERIGAELNVATSIQASMLPSIFPAFPERKEIDVYASMQPAKEVGGDFYDFFLIDERTLAVVMADVSGKGVPAALFMVIAKTLIKNNAQNGKSPKEVFEMVNNLLCENNEAGMFVTAFMGYLDIPSGKFSFVNAGHNPPLIRKGQEFDWLKSKIGFVLAGMEDMFYTQAEIVLDPGDELFLYTDGVTEAMNNENQLFTDPRLLDVSNQYKDLPLKEFTISIKREIDKFAEGAEQADDITMLAMRYLGVGGMIKE